MLRFFIKTITKFCHKLFIHYRRYSNRFLIFGEKEQKKERILLKRVFFLHLCPYFYRNSNRTIGFLAAVTSSNLLTDV